MLRRAEKELNWEEGFSFWPGLSYGSNYAAVFKGTIAIGIGQLYNFYLRSNDGAILIINSQELINNEGCFETMTEKTVYLPLSPHEH